jgi:DUF1680 family protein
MTFYKCKCYIYYRAESSLRNDESLTPRKVRKTRVGAQGISYLIDTFMWNTIRMIHLIAACALLAACDKGNESASSMSSGLSDYPIRPVDIRSVKLTDEFWLPIIKDVQERTIDYALRKCEEEGRFENFMIAGGKMKGEVRGMMPFDDTDVYKTIEGASNSLISAPNKELETLLDSLIAIIKTGQEEDGYLTTWRTINPAKPPAKWVKVDEGKRWESMEASHEDYNAGHLYEAAVVHYLATGKRNMLDIAIKNADLMVKTFGKGKLERVPGHQIIETGLIKLYRVTGNKEYLNLARYFLDTRGDYSSGRTQFGEYAQDHLPVVKQDEVKGHAVRAVYMYAGMTDIAAIFNDSSYLAAINKLWDNMVTKKMYITGGIGARHEGESFGDNYELPNLTAYAETCAAIGSVYWNHRMFLLTGDVKYYDVIERTLYNGLISGLSLDGEKFFYPNALEADGVYKFNIGACSRQSWFDCSCCPTNMIRFLPSMPGLIYASIGDTLVVNLYASNEASVDLNGKRVNIKQETSYPWDGKVNITITSETPADFVVKVRVPGWARGQVVPGDLYSFAEDSRESSRLYVDGEKVSEEVVNGYYILNKRWSSSTIALDLPMEVHKVMANENVQEDRGKISLEVGPLVYAFEEVDNKKNFDKLKFTGSEAFAIQREEGLLEGVNVLTMTNDHQFKAIPYYAWSNRGIGKMKVWIPIAND